MAEYLSDEEMDKRGLPKAWPGNPIEHGFAAMAIEKVGRELAKVIEGARIHNIYSWGGKVHVLTEAPGCPNIYLDIFPGAMNAISLEIVVDHYNKLMARTQLINIDGEEVEAPYPPNFSEDVFVISDDETEEIYALMIGYNHFGATASREQFI